jgi:hypothetical protein
LAKRKAAPRSRSRSRQTKSSAGLWPWMVALAVTIGAIGVYENRAAILPKSLTAPFQAAKNAPPAKANVVPAAKPAVTAKPQKQAARQESAKSSGPVPPMPIGKPTSAITTATVPADRPVQELAAAAAPKETGGEQQQVKFGTQYSFCGRSGLQNCVEDGRIFWRGGKKQVLSGIRVARTDEAACVDERRKGYAAKVRLRDFLNQGGFEQASSENNLSISRGGQRFEDQLLKEGLAFPVSQKNQSWCG